MSRSQALNPEDSWRQRIDSHAERRCDLDILLREPLRHTLVLRDHDIGAGDWSERGVLVEAGEYDRIRQFVAEDDARSLRALVLTAMHAAIGAYGHGSVTIVACAEQRPGGGWLGHRLLPSIHDHEARGLMPRAKAVEEVERALAREHPAADHARLIGRGLFDAVMVVAEKRPLPAVVPFPLAVLVRDHPEMRRLELIFAYASNLMEDRTIEGLADVLRNILDQIVRAGSDPLAQVELLSAAQTLALDAWNATDGAFPSDVRLNHLFEAAVRRSPDREALVDGFHRLTFRALNETCNRLARWLLARGGGRSREIVALFLDKSRWTVIAELAAWKAGCGFVPIDPSYPEDRIGFILGDVGAQSILTNRSRRAALAAILEKAAIATPVVAIEDVVETPAFSALPSDDLALDVGSDAIAYVAYTSGTTGVPKGVAKPHRSVVNSITDLSDRYGMLNAADESVALFATYVFEPFVRQMLIALINAHRLVIVPDDVRLDPLALPEFLRRHRITYLNGTRSVIQHYDLIGCPALRRILLVGEELTAADLRALRKRFTGPIVNEYSFTETAFVTAVKMFPPDVQDRRDRSIGRPLRNVKCYVLTPDLRRVPVGAIGELFVGGEGIARGYLNRDDLSKASFFSNPYRTNEEVAHGANDLIYRTGDLARYLPDGEIEFLGRSDFQLKLSGVRVEPGEIEARALEYPGVRQCIVVACGSDEPGTVRYLAGYFVADPDCDADGAALCAYLRSRLIPVMAPRRMMRLPALPTNVNGKIDRRSLPPIDRSFAGPGAPQGADAVVSVLASIWSEVLGLTSAVASDDDFFLLGGHSIACIQLISRIWQQLHARLTLKQVFQQSRFGAMAALVAEATDLESSTAHPRDPAESDRSTSTGALRANGLHQGLMYHALRTQGADDAYVIQSVYRYRTNLNPDLLRQAWQVVYRRFPGLRLRFSWGDEPVQIIGGAELPIEWWFSDCSDLEGGAQEAEIRRLQERDRAKPFVLTEGPLFRVGLAKESDEAFSLVFSCHHIVIDGWSLPLLHDAVHEAYISLLEDRPVDAAPDLAYIAAQHYWSAHRADHVDYWNGQLDRIIDRSDLNGLVNVERRYKIDLATYDRIFERRIKTLRIGAERTAIVKALCAERRATLHSALQFVWHRTLCAFGGARTTVVGTIVSGRMLPIDHVESSVGLFINTLPLIVDHVAQRQQTVGEAIAEIQQYVNEMNSRTIVEFGALRTGELKHKLFDTLLVLENYPRLLSEAEAGRHLAILRYEKTYDIDKVDYPIAVVTRELEGALAIDLWYAGELFDDEAIARVLDTVRTLFEQIARGFDRRVADLDALPPSAEEQLALWNRTCAPFPREATLHRIFEDVACRWPDEPAVRCGEVEWSYAKLNEESDRFARCLHGASALRPDDLVALVMDKSERMIAAILGVWKAGAAYVPIDPAAPDDRIAFMLDDTKALLTLADPNHVERLRRLSEGLARRVIDAADLPLDDAPVAVPQTPVTPENLAYAIYTSGTTGRPKAVLVEHHGVVNLHASLAKLFGLRRENGREAILSFSNYVFDHFVEQMTDALLSGQKLVILDDAMRAEPERLYRYMRDHEVTYLSGMPSVLSLFDYSAIPSLRRIDAIGEDFTSAKFARIRSSFGGLIINGYGPTEISITSHKRLYERAEPRRDKSIGRSVANTVCYVVDDTGKRVPVGGVGELLIGGEGVARGYLNRERLTRQRFIDNPFGRDAELNPRLYRTGDLVRWLPNGELEYLGRNDFQVKIRGHRVELGEIEAVMASFAGISRAAVITCKRSDTGEDQLLAYFVSEDAVDPADVRRWMIERLPTAIIPAHIQRLPDFPVTSSGKLDIRRLPSFDPADDLRGCHEAPADEISAQLCLIWSKVLGIAPEKISVQDDFFALGGDSLRAIILSHAVSADFASEMSLATVFQHRTIASQAQYVRARPVERRAEDRPEVAPMLKTGDAPVSVGQEQLLFFADFEGGSAAYNVPLALEIRLGGLVSTCAVEQALRTIVRRHPALRTLLKRQYHGVASQRVLTEHEALQRFALPGAVARDGAELDATLAREATEIFDLERDLPLRVRLIQIGDDPSRLIVSLVLHHSCFDGWSWSIFRQEFAALVLSGGRDELPVPASSYAEFAFWQRERLRGGNLSALRDFWSRALSGYTTLSLPIDRPRPRYFDFRGDVHVFDLSPEEVEALRSLAGSVRVSLFVVLLAAYVLTLRIFTHQDDILVGTPSANRIQPRFRNVIGFFANLLVLRVVQENGRMTVLSFLRSVGDTMVRAMAHQEAPFELLVRSLGVERDPSRHPLVQTVFGLETDVDVQDGVSSAYGAWMEPRAPHSGAPVAAKFDLAVVACERQSGLRATLTYATSLFKPSTIANFADAFRAMLVALGEHAHSADTATVADLGPPGVCLEPSGHRRARGRPGNQLAVERTLHEMFEDVARQRSDAPAVYCGDVEWSYARLAEESDRFARCLHDASAVRPDDFVALVMDKSERMIAAILGVWKAGAAYVPIDPTAPDDRIAFMLDDTHAVAVLADPDHVSRLRRISEGAGRRVIDAADLPPEDAPAAVSQTPVTPKNLAYAIYTSGTTGRPKAVLVEHRGVARFRDEVDKLYFADDGASDETLLLLSHYTFDFSIEQLALSILNGARLIIPVAPTFSEAFHAEIARRGPTHLSGTPTQIERIDLARLPTLRRVVLAGEAFLPNHFRSIRQQYSGPLFNAYGTTETTVYNLVRRYGPDDPYGNDLGLPLGNSSVLILDRDRRPAPEDAIGELWMSGPCVSRGYLARPELTAERFVADSFLPCPDRSVGEDGILYRTGDLVRRCADGSLEYLGRNDLQVKIRGVRIEPGEIEAVLSTLPGIRQCAVVAREDPRRRAEKRLVAYYVPENGLALADCEIRRFLEERLARTMTPAAIVPVDSALPLTTNGKLDVRALPEPKPDDYPATPPTNAVEARLRRLWSSLLPSASIGIDEDFFRSGGDSILALQLTARMQRAFGRRLTVRALFEFPTIRRYASYALGPADAVDAADASPPATGSCPLLPIQRWFFAKRLPHHAPFSQYVAIRTGPIDRERLRESVRALVDFHDAFRLRFRQNGDGTVEQFYCDACDPAPLEALHVADLSHEEIERCLPLHDGFDLEQGPLYRVVYLHGFKDGSARVWFAMHHLMVDVVSWHVLAQDLELLYRGNSLGPRRTSYRRWCEAVGNYRGSPDERAHWNRIANAVADQETLLGLSSVGVVRRQRFQIDEAITSTLLARSHGEGGIQPIDRLLAAVGCALHAVTGRRRHCVALEGHGRELFDGAPEVSDSVGWYTTIHPVEVDWHDDLLESVAGVRAARARAPNNGIGYGALRGTYGQAGAPLPPVSLNFLGTLADDRRAASGEELNWRLDSNFFGVSRPEASRDGAVDVTVRSENGRLLCDVECRFPLSLARRFGDTLRQSLIDLAESNESGVLADRRLRSSPASFDCEQDVYVVVNETIGGAKTLFVLPPGEGGAESYLGNIAQQIEGARLVLFNNIHRRKRMDSFEDLAKFYIGHIRGQQPAGPYHLAGWSFGGVLAFEIAVQLARAGETIAGLALIDPFFNVSKALKDLNLVLDPQDLDPVHERYRPSSTDLSDFTAATRCIKLFKATRSEPRFGQSPELLDYYVRTAANHLDTLIPGDSYSIVPMRDQTHFSWVGDRDTVASVATQIASLVADSRKNVVLRRARDPGARVPDRESQS